MRQIIAQGSLMIVELRKESRAYVSILQASEIFQSFLLPLFNIYYIIRYSIAWGLWKSIIVIPCHDRYYDGPTLTAFSRSLVWCLSWWGQAIGYGHWRPLLGVLLWCLIFKASNYTLLQRNWKGGVYWFHLVLMFVRPSVRPSVCGQSRVRTLSSTILSGFISIFKHLLKQLHKVCRA